jgi:membrane protease YdiL (CAAX protease family)
MNTQSSFASIRDQMGSLIRSNKLFIVAEMLVVLAFQALHVVGALPTGTIPILLAGWLSLWLRRSGWRSIGMRRPANWGRTLLLGIGFGLACNALDWAVITPLMERAAGLALDMSQFDSLRGNLVVLLIWLALAWTLGAFGEEMVWRGYVLNRVADLFGRRRAGWVVGLLGMGVLFGLGHAYQGLPGIMTNFLWGILYGVLYLASGRNLWLPIVAHGVEDTTSLTLLFFGLSA